MPGSAAPRRRFRPGSVFPASPWRCDIAPRPASPRRGNPQGRRRVPGLKARARAKRPTAALHGCRAALNHRHGCSHSVGGGYLAAPNLAERLRTMSKLQLSVAVGNYDRVRPLMDGAVQIDGVDPVFMNLPPEEIFFRAFRGMDFDICELSMSSFTVKTAERNCPYVGRAGLRLAGVPSQLDLCAPRPRSSRPPTSRASASGCRNISSPPASGRASSWRTTTA